MITFRKRRGQAFETMMLVISVIVAIAILGVLTGILGGIGGIGGAWTDAVKDSLKQVSTYGVTSAKTITIKKGDSLDANGATKDLSTFSAKDLKFVLTESLKGGNDFDSTAIDDAENSELVYTGSAAQKNFDMVVAANAEKEGDKRIFVCIGTSSDKKGEKAADICRTCRNEPC